MAPGEKLSEHPKTVGDRTTAHVLASLVDAYPNVLVPFGENCRYDLLIDDGQRFLRVQCKTGRLRNGAIWFKTCSYNHHHPANRGTKPYMHHYRGAADLFGVYCPQTRGVYLVPVEDVDMKSACLRVHPSKNNQMKKVRWASDFEVRPPG